MKRSGSTPSTRRRRVRQASDIPLQLELPVGHRWRLSDTERHAIREGVAAARRALREAASHSDRAA